MWLRVPEGPMATHTADTLEMKDTAEIYEDDSGSHVLKSKRWQGYSRKIAARGTVGTVHTI